jgi:sigma-B regulation protein RsbU (phosphoserine phosphatase)
VPFALFFGTLWGHEFGGYLQAYKISVVFALVVSLCIRANVAWVIPRLPGGNDETSRARLGIHSLSYVMAGMLGAFIAGAILNLTIAHGLFGSGRSLVVLGLFSFMFSILVVGISLTLRFHGAYVTRVRQEEQIKAKIEHEIRTAAQIQQALLPHDRALSPRFEAAGACLPSRTIGGDFLDYFEVPGNRLAFVLGDVSGKGPPAAIMAAAIQGMFFSVADESDESPAETIRRVNGALVRRSVESKFATVFHGLLTPEGRMVTCNAGHNPPLLLRRDGTTEWVTKGGLMVGIFEQAQFEDEGHSLAAGDALVLFSDGVTEAESVSGDMYGEERLLASLVGSSNKSASEIVHQVLDEVAAFSDGAGQADDITVLVVRYVGA